MEKLFFFQNGLLLKAFCVTVRPKQSPLQSEQLKRSFLKMRSRAVKELILKLSIKNPQEKEEEEEDIKSD